MTTTLHVPDIEGMTPAEAALAYAEAGWYLVPVANGTKHPGSVLGGGWETKSTRDPGMIGRWWRANPDFGIALHAGKSGVTILDIDHPERLHPAVVRALTELAPPFQSSRRGQPTKGHAIFLTPEGRDLGNAIGSLKGGWGEIRGRNGVIIAAPSTHAEAIHGDGDGYYEWQVTGDVPALPAYVADLLPDARDAAAPATTAAVEAFLDAHTVPGSDTRHSERSARMIGAHVTGFETAAAARTSRHMSILGHACGAMREAADGLLDARTAADTLGSVFLAYAGRQDAGSGKPRVGREGHDEWTEILAYAVGAASASTPGEGAARVKARADAYKATHNGVATLTRAPLTIPQSWDGDNYHHADDAAPIDEPWTEDEPSTEGEGEPVDESDKIDEAGILADLFAATPTLRHIQRAAHSRFLSAPMVLSNILAITLLHAPPGWQLPPTIASVASLNLGFAIVGNSSGGKSASMDVAQELLTVDQERICPWGSGEGMLDAFLEPDPTPTDKNATRLILDPHRMFTADEIETVGKLMERSGSTLGTFLKSAVTGGGLGTTNTTAGGRKRKILKHSYRFVTVMAIQPALAGVLLAGENSGLPQRFLWSHAGDPTLPEELDDIDTTWPGPLPRQLATHRFIPEHNYVDYPQHIKDEIKAARHAESRNPDLVDPLQGHLRLTRLKVAAAFAILHGDYAITEQWWDLAGVLTDLSKACIRECQVAVEAQSMAATRALGQLDAVRKSAAVEHVGDRTKKIADAVCRTVKSHAAGGGGKSLRHGAHEGCDSRCVSRAVRSYVDRDAYLESAMAYAFREGFIVQEGARLRPGGPA